MNFYTAGSKFSKKLDKHIELLRGLNNMNDEDKTPEEIKEQATKFVLAQEKRHIKHGLLLREAFKEVYAELIEQGLITGEAEKLKQTYFITIRPNENDITFRGFYELIHKFVSRKCFKSFTLVFEQKAIEPPYGKGFHCHILANMSQRSKTEVLRDTQSTFKHCASANCIQVDIVKSNNDLQRITGYILEWKSEDDHKEQTKTADVEWRQQEGLLASYTEARQLSSPLLAGRKEIQSGPIIISLS